MGVNPLRILISDLGRNRVAVDDETDHLPRIARVVAVADGHYVRLAIRAVDESFGLKWLRQVRNIAAMGFPALAWSEMKRDRHDWILAPCTTRNAALDHNDTSDQDARLFGNRVRFDWMKQVVQFPYAQRGIRTPAKDANVTNPDIVVIVNPGAAGGKALKAVPVINRTLEALDCPYAIYVTKERGDAIQAARSYAESGVSRILAVGGDGTVNEVANGIYQSGSDTALGLVPVGHGTDLARHLGTTRQVDLAVQRACQGEPARIDLGLAKYADNTERAFINIAGLGFDAIVASKAQKSRLPGGNLPYLGSALTTLVGFQNLQVTIDADGQRIETAGVFVQIANAQYMGGGYHFAPMAAMDDGLLDVCIVGDFGKFELIRAIPSVYKGKHVTHSKFSHVTAKCITIETSTPAMVQLDGELVGQTPVQFSVLPAAIALVK